MIAARTLCAATRTGVTSVTVRRGPEHADCAIDRTRAGRGKCPKAGCDRGDDSDCSGCGDRAAGWLGRCLLCRWRQRHTLGRPMAPSAECARHRQGCRGTRAGAPGASGAAAPPESNSQPIRGRSARGSAPIAQSASIERVVPIAQRLAVTVVTAVAAVTRPRAGRERYQKILDHRPQRNGADDPRSFTARPLTSTPVTNGAAAPTGRNYSTDGEPARPQLWGRLRNRPQESVSKAQSAC